MINIIPQPIGQCKYSATHPQINLSLLDNPSSIFVKSKFSKTLVNENKKVEPRIYPVDFVPYIDPELNTTVCMDVLLNRSGETLTSIEKGFYISLKAMYFTNTNFAHISVSDVAKKLKIRRQYAHKLFNKLAEKGYIKQNKEHIRHDSEESVVDVSIQNKYVMEREYIDFETKSHKNQFIILNQSILKLPNKTLTFSQKCIYATICCFFNSKTNNIKISHNAIERYSGCKKRYIIETIKLLEHYDFIEVVRSGIKKCNEYRIVGRTNQRKDDIHE